ncbi:MAG: AAA family ATPase, partial [Chloroflexota bacterium]
YWLAKMVYAGEDPRFIFRRMLIFASEDIGLADPMALVVAQAAAAAFDRVGLPEGRFHLSQTALYLATAPKSNSTLGFFDALSQVESERDSEVPSHLRDASRDSEQFGHGKGYLYPHAYRDHWVAQQYLPDSLQGKVFYEPSEQGHELQVRQEVTRHREAQLAAMLETGGRSAPPEVLTYTPPDRQRDRWLARTISGQGQRLADLRDSILDHAKIQRHHLVLDLNATTGLLLWEAVRRAPEGGVWGITNDVETATVLRQQARYMAELEQPAILIGELLDLDDLLLARSEEHVRFDSIVGRNALVAQPDKEITLSSLAALMKPEGLLSLSEAVPSLGQRLSDLVSLEELDDELTARLIETESNIYTNSDDPVVNWQPTDLEQLCSACGFQIVLAKSHTHLSNRTIASNQLEAWFAVDTGSSRPTFADHLRKQFTPAELEQIQTVFVNQLSGRTVEWRTTSFQLVASS